MLGRKLTELCSILRIILIFQKKKTKIWLLLQKKLILKSGVLIEKKTLSSFDIIKVFQDFI